MDPVGSPGFRAGDSTGVTQSVGSELLAWVARGHCLIEGK